MTISPQKDRFINTAFENEIPFSNRIIIYAIAIFIALFLVWASNATLDEVARGRGQVVPSSEIKIVESLDAGLIEDIFVSEGDRVKANQPVLQLRDIQARSELGAKQQELYSLQAKAIRLKAQAKGKEAPDFGEVLKEKVPETVEEEYKAFLANKRNLESQLDVFERQKTQKRQEIQETKSRIADLKSVLELTREEYDILEPLVQRGSASKVELMQIERQMQEQQTELNSLESSIPRMREAVRELSAKAEEIRNRAQAEAQAELTSVTQKINSLINLVEGLQDKKFRTELKAPVSGIIKEMLVSTVGEVVKPGEELIQIVPDNDRLIIEARISPEQIAFLNTGQKAVVQITAYDFAVYGGLTGEVVEISADSIIDEQGESFYRVRVLTDKNKIVRKNETLPIIPGMVASVDIVTGQKTVMDYILNPIVRTLDRSLREK